ncbi:MAG: tetratricopeptide repeat protein [Gemmataceae bacterium]
MTLHGFFLRELAHYSQAEPPLLQALSLLGTQVGKEHPDYALTLLELGSLYADTARYPSAEKLTRSAVAILEKHPDQPLLLGHGLYELSGLLDLMGQLREASELSARSLELLCGHLGEDHVLTARSKCLRAWSLWRAGHLEKAGGLIVAAVKTLREAGPSHPELAIGLQILSRLELHHARLDVAQQLANEAVAIRKLRLGDTHHRYAGALENLALVRAVQGHHDEAEQLVQQALEITIRSLGERHPHVADGHAAMGYVLQSRRDAARAEKEYLIGLEIYRAVHGEQHPNVAGFYRDLAECCAVQQRFTDAEEYYRLSLARLEPLGDICIAETVESLQGLARVLAGQNRSEEALATAEQAAQKARESSGDRNLLLASALESLARIYHGQGQLSEAEPVWREVLDCRRQAVGENHPNFAEGLRCLANLYAAQGRLAEAEELELRALGILNQSLGETHSEYVQALQSLADLQMQKGDLARAESYLIQAVDIERQRVGDVHPDHAHAIAQLARLYLAVNNYQAAEVRYRQVVEILERTRGEEHPEFAAALYDLGSLYHQAGELSAAENLYQRARDIRQTHPGEDHPDYGLSLHGLALVYQAQGRIDEAGPLFHSAVENHEAALGRDNPATLRLVHSLALHEQSRGHWDQAAELLGRVREQFTHLFGPGSPILIPVLSDLARQYGSIGDHLAAEPLWRQIQEIHRAAFSHNVSLHAQDHLNLASCLRSQGRLVQAEAEIREALALYERQGDAVQVEGLATRGILAGVVQAQDRLDEALSLYTDVVDRARLLFGQYHQAVATLLLDLGGVCAQLGQADQAFAYYQQAQEIFRRAPNETLTEMINLQRSQAEVLQGQGRMAEAEAILLERQQTLRRAFGDDAPALVSSYHLLADVCLAQGKLPEAEKYSTQALDVLRKFDQQQSEEDSDASPNVSRSVHGMAQVLAENHLGQVHLTRGRADLAEPLLRSARKRLLASAGPDHPLHPAVVLNLAAAMAAQGRWDQVREYLASLANLDRRLLPQFLALTGARPRAFACQGPHDRYEVALSALFASGSPPTAEECQATFDLVLQRKRFGIHVLADAPFTAWMQEYPALAGRLERLWLLDRQLASKRLAGPGPEGLTKHQELLQSWYQQRDDLEAELGQEIPALAEYCRMRSADTDAVCRALPAGWALVEVVHHRHVDLTRLHEKNLLDPVDRALAFVVRTSHSPHVVQLGEGSQLDSLVMACRAELEAGNLDKATAQLGHLFWRQILPLLPSDCQGVILALDGPLLHLPVEVLPLPPELDRPLSIHQVFTGRDLLRTIAPPARSVLFIEDSAPGTSLGNPFGQIWGSIRRWMGKSTAPAPGQASAASLASLLNAVPRPASQATRDSLERIGALGLIHLPCPVFFHVPAEASGWRNTLSLMGISLAGETPLTALDLCALDLRATRLVVLAGCATHPTERGEWLRLGGLVQACLHAGAHHVLVRLWGRPDPRDDAFLPHFYRQLAEGRSLPEAVSFARSKVGTTTEGWVLIGRGPRE